MGNEHGECRWWSWSPKAQPIGTRATNVWSLHRGYRYLCTVNRKPLWLQRVRLWESIISAIPIAIWNITDIRQLDCMEDVSRNVKCSNQLHSPTAYFTSLRIDSLFHKSTHLWSLLFYMADAVSLYMHILLKCDYENDRFDKIQYRVE